MLITDTLFVSLACVFLSMYAPSAFIRRYTKRLSQQLREKGKKRTRTGGGGGSRMFSVLSLFDKLCSSRVKLCSRKFTGTQKWGGPSSEVRLKYPHHIENSGRQHSSTYAHRRGSFLPYPGPTGDNLLKHLKTDKCNNAESTCGQNHANVLTVLNVQSV